MQKASGRTCPVSSEVSWPELRNRLIKKGPRDNMSQSGEESKSIAVSSKPQDDSQAQWHKLPFTRQPELREGVILAPSYTDMQSRVPTHALLAFLLT